jgi:hypothetical protein
LLFVWLATSAEFLAYVFWRVAAAVRRIVEPCWLTESRQDHDTAGAACLSRFRSSNQVGERGLVTNFACDAKCQLDDEIAIPIPLAGNGNPIASPVTKALIKRIADSASSYFRADV